MDVLERIAKEIDPMAWKAWEITSDVEVRKKVSVAKAKSALQGIRHLDADIFAAVGKELTTDQKEPAELARTVWTSIIDKLTDEN